ncbi:FLYWCH zinc finger domain-containing protein [Phthorimaea operculella]|nr:FLYWCH zinc finger domain-containing protein [Phthorimaea operculella]
MVAVRVEVYCLACRLSAVVWLHNQGGKELAVYEGFTFFLHQKNKASDVWRCTKSGGGGGQCRANIFTTKTKAVLRMQPEHNHPPPNFVVRNGVIIKI